MLDIVLYVLVGVAVVAVVVKLWRDDRAGALDDPDRFGGP